MEKNRSLHEQMGIIKQELNSIIEKLGANNSLSDMEVLNKSRELDSLFLAYLRNDMYK